MNDSRLLEKFTKRKAPAADPSQEGEADDAESFGCFGWLRGVRDRAIMLELRRKDGHVLAVGYSWLERVEFEPSEGITLHLPGRTIRIKGSGLNVEIRSCVRLFDGIVRHRVPWVLEADRASMLKSQADPVLVESIEWDP